METSAVGVLGQPQRSNDRGLDSLKSEDFFRILVTELQQQDPLDPGETSDMISQVSDIRSIELSDQLNGSLDALTGQQRTANVGSLLGKYVSAFTQGPDGSAAITEGVVTGVRFDDKGAAVLELDTGQAIKSTDVQHVSELANQDVSPSVDVNELTQSILDAVTGTTPQQEQAAVPDDKDVVTQRTRRPWNWLDR